MVPDNVGRLQRTMGQAKDLGYNGIVLEDFKFDILDRLEPEYFHNLKQVSLAAAKLELDLYPVIAKVGYSNGLLTVDPNLAEGVPVTGAPYRVRRDEAAPVASLLHGLTADQVVQVSRFRQYHLSVEVRTKDFISREVTAAVRTTNGRSIAYFDRLPAANQEWQKHEVVFNSLDQDHLEVRPIGWLDGSGEYHCKNATLEEIRLVNVIRREGAPLTVSDQAGITFYQEGKDFEVEKSDTGLMPRPGEYAAYHRPLRLLLPPGSAIGDGQTILVNYYHALVVREGSVTNCLSAEEVYQHIEDQIARVQALLAPKGFLLALDEVRVANWCETCRQRKLTPGQLLADHIRRCIELVHKRSPSADILVWSDMLDPLHNAHDHYYLVNGDANGSWEGLNEEVIIANWNFTAIEASPKWFAQRGHRQVVAGYFDREIDEIGEWARVAANTQGVCGAMYVTWEQDYSHLGTFAGMMWNNLG